MKAKIGAIFLVSVMAFAAIGAAYAHWEETLTITGEMRTDDINPFFECPQTNDPNDPLTLDPTDCGDWVYVQVDGGIGHWEWQGQRRAKDVGYCNVNVDPADDNHLEISIGDAYPCYYAHPFFCIKNSGSAPVQVYGIKLVEVSYKNETVDEHIPVNKIMAVDDQFGIQIYQTAAGVWKARFHDDVNNALDDFSLKLTGQDMAVGTQLDPMDWADDYQDHTTEPYVDTLYGDLCIHMENGCEQDTTYDFVIEIVFWNWPEVVIS